MRKMKHLMVAMVAMVTMVMAAVATPAMANVNNPLEQNSKFETSFSWISPGNQFRAETVLKCVSPEVALATTEFIPTALGNLWELPIKKEWVETHFEFLHTKPNGFKVWGTQQHETGKLLTEWGYDENGEPWGHYLIDQPITSVLEITSGDRGYINISDIRGNVLFKDGGGNTALAVPFRIKLPQRYAVNCRNF